METHNGTVIVCTTVVFTREQFALTAHTMLLCSCTTSSADRRQCLSALELNSLSVRQSFNDSEKVSMDECHFTACSVVELTKRPQGGAFNGLSLTDC